MKRIHSFFILLLLILTFLNLISSKEVSAKPARYPITTPAEMIEAINHLRVSYGLAPLSAHPILMQTAQAQADYMAATGDVTHARSNGMTYTQQLLSLGFPLSGDLSLGGYRAENIIYSQGYLEWDGVPPGWQDELHMNTMLSQNYTHIGAGISHADGAYYYAVDTAASTSNGQMQSTAKQILEGVSETSVEAAGVSQYMVPITKSTADVNGNVYHRVEYGQTLWSIAIAYGTTIKDIQALNNLGEGLTIYQGQNLLILQNVPPAIPTIDATTIIQSTSTFSATATTSPTSIASQITVTSTLENVEADFANSQNSRLLVVVLIVVAFIGAGVAVWFIREPSY
jgi:LysM repeat protein